MLVKNLQPLSHTGEPNERTKKQPSDKTILLYTYEKLLWIQVCKLSSAYPGPSRRKLCVSYDAICLQQPVNILETIWILQRKNFLRHLTSKRLDQSTRDFAGRFSSTISTFYQIFAAIRHPELPVDCIAVFRAFSTIKTEPRQLELRGFYRWMRHSKYYLRLFFRRNWSPNGLSIADRANEPLTGDNSGTA